MGPAGGGPDRVPGRVLRLAGGGDRRAGSRAAASPPLSLMAKPGSWRVSPSPRRPRPRCSRCWRDCRWRSCWRGSCCRVSRWSARWCWCRSWARRPLSGWLSGRSRRTAGSRRSCWSTRSSTWPCWRGPSRGSGHISILVRSARHARWAPRRGGRSARPRCRRWHLLSLTQRPWCSCSAPHFGVVVILGGAAYRTLETEIYLRMVNLLNLSGAAAVARPVRRGGGCPRRRRGGTQAPGNHTAPALRFESPPQAGTRRAVGRGRRMCGAGPAARTDHRTGGQVRVHIGRLGFAVSGRWPAGARRRRCTCRAGVPR